MTLLYVTMYFLKLFILPLLNIKIIYLLLARYDYRLFNSIPYLLEAGFNFSSITIYVRDKKRNQSIHYSTFFMRDFNGYKIFKGLLINCLNCGSLYKNRAYLFVQLINV
jgi:hypothetical protein